MPTDALLEATSIIHHAESAIEHNILRLLDEEDVVSLDTLIALLPQYSWNQIFHTVDRLARTARIVLRRHRFDYTLFSNRYAS